MVVQRHYSGEAKKFTSFAANLFRKRRTIFHQNRPSCVGDITKKHSGLFFRDTVENRSYNHFKSRPSHATDKSQHLRKVMSDYEYSGSYIIRSRI